MKLEWKRGFVWKIECTLAFWVGEPCHWCDDHPGVEPRWEMSHCPECHGAGRINAHGPQIVAVQPVEEVKITDPETRESYPHELTWGLLEPGGGPPINLSDACVAWARREAGLPPLK